MHLIYEPTGAAREYSPLALNVYTGGCEHRCVYCYCRNGREWTARPKVRNLNGQQLLFATPRVNPRAAQF